MRNHQNLTNRTVLAQYDNFALIIGFQCRAYAKALNLTIRAILVLNDNFPQIIGFLSAADMRTHSNLTKVQFCSNYMI